MLDNFPSHKVGGICERSEAVGARLFYRPPYPPDFNPIDLAFATRTAIRRAKAARTIHDL